MGDKLTAASNIATINENNGFEDMLNVLSIPFSNDEKFYLLWDEQKNIDIFSISDLKNFWDYIWYGSGDEALVLFIPEKIVLMIYDWREIKFKDLS